MSTKEHNTPPRKGATTNSKKIKKHLRTMDFSTSDLHQASGNKLSIEENIFHMENVDSFTSMDEIILILSNNSADAFVILTTVLLNSNYACMDVIFLSELKIFGDDITDLWEKYCGCNLQKFADTIHSFRTNSMTQLEVEKLVQPIYERWEPAEFEPVTI